MFFKFRQNNSGGRFVIDDKDGLGPEVWIEANGVRQARKRARDIGLYFDGVRTGRDCGCCGDRWDADPWDKKNQPIISKNDFCWHGTVYVHSLDGDILRVHLTDPTPKFLG